MLATGPSYLRARYYDPSTAQFISRDPAVASTRQPYAYSYDNPLNMSDPTGLFGLDDLKHLGGMAAGAAAGAVESVHAGAVMVAKAALNYGAETAGACASRTASGVGQCSMNVVVALTMIVPGGGEAESGGLVIGRTADLLAEGALREGESTLLPQLAGDLGSPAANWARNSGALRAAIRGCNSVRDASAGDTGGAFLNAERNLLSNHGFGFDEATSIWTR